jgi:hypothetical protein
LTVETRYFRSDTDPDGYYQLLTSNTASGTTLSTSASGELTPYIGIRVRKEDGTVIKDWVETVIYSATYAEITLNVEIPSTSVVRVIVDVRVRVNGTSATRSFRTEELNSTVSGTWSFKLWARGYYSSPPADRTYAYFAHGSSTYPSRIENFTWGVVAVVKKPIMKMDLGPHPRSRLLFAPTLFLGAKTIPVSPPPTWDGWDYLWVAVL